MRKHPLTDWRKRHGVAQDELARRISVSRWTVNRIECGERFPGRETIGRIVAVTNGEINAAELMGLPDPSLSG